MTHPAKNAVFQEAGYINVECVFLTVDIIARMIEINDDDDFDLRTSCDRL